MQLTLPLPVTAKNLSLQKGSTRVLLRRRNLDLRRSLDPILTKAMTGTLTVLLIEAGVLISTVMIGSGVIVVQNGTGARIDILIRIDILTVTELDVMTGIATGTDATMTEIVTGASMTEIVTGTDMAMGMVERGREIGTDVTMTAADVMMNAEGETEAGAGVVVADEQGRNKVG